MQSLANLDPKWTLVIFSFAPLSLLPIYLFVLQEPEIVIDSKDIGRKVNTARFSKQLEFAETKTTDPSFISPMFSLPIKERIGVISPLLQYIVPLAVVYLIEYAINSGIAPVMTFKPKTSALSEKDQFVLYQFLYNTGNFLGRCSVNVLHTRKVWIFVIAQSLIFVLLFTGVRYDYLPGLWFASIFTLVEGVMGGAVYVNSFYAVARKALPEHKELSMGLVSISDTLGILSGGICGIFIQLYLCEYSSSPHCT